jgi:hypothetical protein
MINLVPMKLGLPRLDIDHRLRDLRKAIDRRTLRVAIERLHIAAVEHECHGVAPGDQIFSRLYNQLRRLAQVQPLEQ